METGVHSVAVLQLSDNVGWSVIGGLPHWRSFIRGFYNAYARAPAPPRTRTHRHTFARVIFADSLHTAIAKISTPRKVPARRYPSRVLGALVVARAHLQDNNE